MRELHVCGQADVLCVLSLLCPWPKIYIEYAKIPFCDKKGAIKTSSGDGRAPSNTNSCWEEKEKSASAASVLPNVQLVHVSDGFAQVH